MGPTNFKFVAQHEKTSTVQVVECTARIVQSALRLLPPSLGECENLAGHVYLVDENYDAAI